MKRNLAEAEGNLNDKLSQLAIVKAKVQKLIDDF